MRTISKYIQKLALLIALFAICGEVVGQKNIITDPNFERKALVAPECVISELVSVVEVVEGEKSLNNLLDTNLTNSTQASSLVGLDLFADPRIRIKDTKNLYPAGTTAGFCLEMSFSLLTVDLLDNLQIWFYKDGEVTEKLLVDQQDAGLLDLNLISIPGENIVSYYTAKSTKPFDEIAFMSMGVGANVLNQIKIRYGFVGEPKGRIELTNKNKDVLGKVEEIRHLGLYTEWHKGNMVDEDITNYLEGIPPVLGLPVADIGHQLELSWDKEFPAGTEVGFSYEEMGLSVGVFSNASIILTDKDNVSTSYTVNTDLLGVQAGTQHRDVSVIATQKFCKARLNISALSLLGVYRRFYYGYVQEQPNIPVTCDLGISMDASICNSKTEYQLSVKEGVEVNWIFSGYEDFEGQSDNSVSVNLTEDGKVTGLSKDGYYTFTATSKTDPNCSQSMILKRGIEPSTECNVPLEDAEYELSIPRDLSGGISIFGQIENRENILSPNPDDYAVCQPGIDLLNNIFIAGIRRKDGGEISDGTTSRRVGFMMQVPSSLLNVSALEFFYVKLYKDGEQVGEDTYTIDNWNVVSAGVIGTEEASKTRFSVEIPAGEPFDEFSLWMGGVANIRLSKMFIYSAFIEDTDVNCDNPLGCDAVMIGSGGTENATINYDETYTSGVVNVGVGLSGLENLLSGELDKNKYVQYFNTVGVGGTYSISVKMGRVMNATHQAGFVVDKQTFLASVNVLSGTKISTYLNGVWTGDEKSEWNLIGADVIGYGDFAYLMFSPTKPYDEIRLTSGSLVSVTNAIKIYALFIRNDSDGDGIPDCIDPTPCEGGALSSVNLTSGICEGDEVTLTGLATFNVGETKAYTLTVAKGSENPVVTETLNIGSGVFEYTFNAPDAGIYTVTLVADEGTADEDKHVYELKIHPGVTTWYGNATDTDAQTDWNNWDNWSNGAPWSCTNVIIPTYSDKDKKTLISNYPILKEGDFNPCNYIHFEPHAEVVNTPYLTYNKAWVEIELKPNRYYMVATPIKGIYSGDWFISKEGTDLPNYFTELTEENYPANRVTPTIYQRLWEHTAQNKLATGGDGPVAIISETKWTAPYNHMATSYEKRDSYDFNALSVWVHSGTPDGEEATTLKTSYKFRFPKMHTTYFYSDMDGDTLGLSNNLTRKATAGRFIYEDENGEADFPITMTYNNEQYGEEHKVFLVGNPFMSHIDIEKFFDKNDHIKSIKVESEDGNYSSVVQDNNTIIAGSGDKKLRYIPPMQSFFVELSSTDEYNDECSITYTEDMLTQQPGVSGQLRSSSPSDAFYLSASASGQRSSAMLRFSTSASDYYHEGEDADILIDDEVPPAVAVFTVADSHALDIQQRASGGDIPIGFVLPKADEVTLRIDVPEEYAGWVLNDLETGKNYALRSGTNELELGRMLTNIGRFSLRGSAPTGNEVISASQPRIYYFREEGGNTLVVRSAEGMMARCEIYTLAGQLSGVASYETNEYRLPVPPGIKIVKVHFTDGITSTIKTY